MRHSVGKRVNLTVKTNGKGSAFDRVGDEIILLW